jgi:enoyl-CoA hydratase
MDFESIIYEKEEAIATIKLNRPKVLNALNQQLWLEFHAALDDARSDPAVKIVIITGEGRAFSTGADLKESKSITLENYREHLVEAQETSRKLIRFEKPTIAAINGYALGSGCELALACDIRIAAQDAHIGSPVAKIESSVTGGAIRLIQDLIGPAKAREFLFTGEYIDGKEAARIGLVNTVVAPDRLMTAAREMAGKIAEKSAFSIKIMKKGLLLASGGVSLEGLMDYEVEASLACASVKQEHKDKKDLEERKKAQ